MNHLDYRNYLRGKIIVQIGAYNGVDCENYGLREIILEGGKICHLLEPQPKVFEELKNNYSTAKSEMHFHNYAIYNSDDPMTFYQFLDYSSFVDKDGVLANPGSATITVQSKLLSTFLKENNITDIDALFIDVEGVEDVIFDQLFQTDIRPELIRYEWHHVSNLEKMENLIQENGYEIFSCIHSPCSDRVCVRKDILNGV